MKLWSGRFSKNTSHLMDDFHSSIGFDQRLYREDIEGSLAHAAMLKKQGIISAEDEKAIHEGLLSILADMDEGRIDFQCGRKIEHQVTCHRLEDKVLCQISRAVTDALQPR